MHFSAVAWCAGVYADTYYGNMVEHFVRRWKVAELARVKDLSDEGQRAQEFVCELPCKIRMMKS